MSAPLWSAEELVAATGGRMIGHWGADGLDIDSREIGAGELFVALKAARDGHDFVASALARGAAGALVSRVPDGLDQANLLIVDDVARALEALGRYRRNQVHGARIIAVTGSVGKTSTKDMLLHVLSRFGRTHASIRSFNNHFGVPITLARMPRDTEYGVFEIGMNAPDEIAPLAAQVRPEIGMITAIAPVHLEGFADEAGIAVEKASLLGALRKDGLAVVYGDMVHRAAVMAAWSGATRWYGGDAGEYGANDIRQLSLVVDAEGSTSRVAIGGQALDIRLAAAGAHNQINALGVLGVVAALGLPVAEAAMHLADWQAPKGRGQTRNIGGVTIVDQSYNANPLSMRAALSSFALMKANRRIAVLGDMFELGAQSAEFHGDLATIPELGALDILITVGQAMRALANTTPNFSQHFDRYDAVAPFVATIAKPGDAIIFKASLAVGLGKSVDELVNLLETNAQTMGRV